MKEHEDILEAARDRMCRVQDADRRNREDALSDVRFLSGDQWEEKVRTAREAAGKPILTINRLPQFVRQVTGDIRRLNPAIRVIPADEAANEDTAEILAGMIRSIEYRSGASSVYEWAAENAAQSGAGYFRISADYMDEMSFDQDLWVKTIRNPFAVYFDPDAVDPTRKDAEWCFVTSTMTGEDFKEEYPDAETVSFDRDDLTDGLEWWRDGEAIVIAEYYWKKYEDVEIGQLPDGRVIENPPNDPMIVRRRTAKRTKVCWAKISGTEVLEGPVDIPCRHIPVVAVTGEEICVGGEMVRSSVIRHAKDAQQMYNFWSSVDAEMTALQPRAPYLVTPKQVANLETFWEEAHTANRPYLPYNPDEKAAPPMRVPPPVPSTAILQGMAKAADDMKATTGIFDAGLGNSSNETSGVAIRQRQMESDISNSIYTDNLALAIEQAGRILIDMIPKIYDTRRMVRVMGDDETEQLQEVNGLQMSMEGPQPVNDLSMGRFDVRVSVGPNYSTRRQETAESMMAFIQSFPPAAQVAGDLIAKAMDWPDADKIAERLKKTLPPNMLSPDDMTPEEQQQMAQAAQAQMQQQQLMQQRLMIEMQKEAAAAQEAGHDAQKAQFEVMNEQLDLAAKNGELQAIIQMEVQRALMAAFAAQAGAPMVAPQ